MGAVPFGDMQYFMSCNVDAALIAETLCDAARANARTWNYSKAIIESCIADNVLTLEQYKARRLDFNCAVNRSRAGREKAKKMTDEEELALIKEALKQKEERGY